MMANETVPVEMPFGNYTLEGISEIPLPDPLPFLPLAPGWKYVFITVFIWLAYLTIKRVIYWQNNRYRKQAKMQLDHIASQGPSQHGLSMIAQLLKGTSLYVFSREVVVAETGNAWFDLLNSHSKQNIFGENTRYLLGAALYQRNEIVCDEKQWQGLVAQVVKWIDVHPYTGVRPLVKTMRLSQWLQMRGQKDD